MRRGGPFTPKRDGTFDVRLSDVEAQALRRVASDLVDALAETSDPSMRRLFPPAYPDDAERQEEFERFTRDDLVQRKLDAARAVVASIDHGTQRRGSWRGTLDGETAHAWLAVLNDARLVIGTRLDVSEDMDHEPLPAHDPRAPLLNLYLYLGGLEEALIDALASQEFGEEVG